MALSISGILALILSIVIVVKILLVAIRPKSGAKLLSTFLGKHKALFIVELVLAGVVLYFLLQELSFIQVMAGVLFGILLVAMGFTVFGKAVIPMATKLLKDKSLRTSWLPILIWVALAVWVIVDLFIL